MRPQALFTVPRITLPVLNEVYFDTRRCRLIRVVCTSLATISHDELSPDTNWEPVRVEDSQNGFLYGYTGVDLEPLGVMGNEKWLRLTAFLAGEGPEDLSLSEHTEFVRIRKRLGVVE